MILFKKEFNNFKYEFKVIHYFNDKKIFVFLIHKCKNLILNRHCNLTTLASLATQGERRTTMQLLQLNSAVHCYVLNIFI